MVKHGLKGKQSRSKPDQFSIAKKRQGNTDIKSGPTGRDESFTDVDVNLSGNLPFPLCCVIHQQQLFSVYAVKDEGCRLSLGDVSQAKECMWHCTDEHCSRRLYVLER